MWYAILLGAGLLLGIVLMIWALRERKLRCTAETVLKDVMVERDRFSAVANENKDAVDKVVVELGKYRSTNELLCAELNKARDLLVKYADKEAIKAWLLSEINKPL